MPNWDARRVASIALASLLVIALLAAVAAVTARYVFGDVIDSSSFGAPLEDPSAVPVEIARLLQVMAVVGGVIIILILALALLRPRVQRLGTPILLVLLALGGLAGIGSVLAGLQRDEIFRPEIALPILVLAGVMTLLVGLLAVVSFLQAYGLTNRTHALGLPEGSIRAVIALGLLLIFAIVSIFLYADVATPNTTWSPGLSAEDIERLPEDSITGIFPRRVEGGNTVYDVTTVTAVDEGAQDFAQQLLTLLGTLVAALTAFYFGTKEMRTATDAAVAAATAGEAAPETVLPDYPSGEATLAAAPGTTLSDIKVMTSPLFAPLVWSVTGDPGGVVRQVSPGVFEYVRGPQAEDVVSIEFSQARRREASARLTVRVPS